jgi:hypothetical protein
VKRLIRSLTLALAAVQFALPALASVADGLIAIHGRNEPSHVEDVAHALCRPPHSADCAICQFLSSTNSHRSSGPASFVAALVTAVATPPMVPTADGQRLGLNSRAPPTSLA